jgi:hypothetical protein
MNFQDFAKYSFIDKIDLLEQWKENKDIDSLVMALEDQDADITKKATEILAELGKISIPSLLKALDSKKVELRSPAVYALGNIQEKDFKNFISIFKLTFKDPNIYVRKSAIKAIFVSARLLYRRLKQGLEFVFYFIVIAIVQMVTLLFLLLPLVVFIGTNVSSLYQEFKNFVTIILLAGMIPVISGFMAAYLYKSKENNYLLSGLIGVLQSVPYNILLLFLTHKIDLINCFVPFFGFFGGILGYHFYQSIQGEHSEIEIPVEKEDMLLEEEEKTIMHLIYQRVKSSKQLQDQVIIFSTLIGIILLIFLSYSIYNISSVSTNKKRYQMMKYKNPFPYVKLEEIDENP